MESMGAYDWGMPIVDGRYDMFSSSVQPKQYVTDELHSPASPKITSVKDLQHEPSFKPRSILRTSSDPIPGKSSRQLLVDKSRSILKESNNLTKPFPKFVDTLSDWKIGDEGIYETYINHCVVHCNHEICHHIRRTKNSTGHEWKCSGCKKSKSKSATLDPVSKERISKISRNDIDKAAELYKSLGNDHIIQINLQTAKALVVQLAMQQLMHFRTYLLESPSFTPSTIFHFGDYNAAAMDATNISRGFRVYFIQSLSKLHGQTRNITREDLETEMRNSLRMDIVKWMCRWCFSQSRKRGDQPGRGSLVTVVEGLAKGHWGAGIMAVFERMEELVRLVVGVLAWWDIEGRKHGARVMDRS